MRLLRVTMSGVFLLFAALQYNDPDRLMWLGLYGYAALVSLLAVAGRSGWLPAPALLVYGAGFALLAPAIDASWWSSEEAREALGLLLSALWMTVLLPVWVRFGPTSAQAG